MKRSLTPSMRIAPHLLLLVCAWISQPARSSDVAPASIDCGTDTPDTFHVDQSNGHDANNGSRNQPWLTLGHARAQVLDGTICVHEGTYPAFTEHAPIANAAHVTIAGASEATTEIQGISIAYSSGSAAKITFRNLRISAPIRLENTADILLDALTIIPEQWSVAGAGVVGLKVFAAQDITISNSKILNVHRGIQVANSTNTRIVANVIVPKAGTGIQYLGGNENGLIQGNHIYGGSYTGYPENPDAVQDPHASIVSFRSGDVTLRGNQLHGMGSSSGVMFYEPDVAGGAAAYSNVLIENNAIYDTINVYALRIYNLGANFTVRNNLLMSHLREGDCNGATNDARYRYNTALAVHSIAADMNTGGLNLYNNLFVGIVAMGEGALSEESGNVAWSWNRGGWLDQSPSARSTILTHEYRGCGGHDPIFESAGFFSTPLQFSKEPGVAREFTLESAVVERYPADLQQQPSHYIGRMTGSGFLAPEMARPANDSRIGPYGPTEISTLPKPPRLLD